MTLETSGLHLTDVSLSLAGRPLFAPITCQVRPGTLTAITGPSGSGKSSLLLAIAGLLPRAFRIQGQLSLDGRSILALAPERRRIGLIFQDPLLLPHLTVAQNLAFGLSRNQHRSRAARAACVSAALQEIQMAGFEDRDPATLSGGQRARVALMRSLLATPNAVLLDEPFVSLDPVLRREMRALLANLLTARGLPALLVTHDGEDAEALANQTLSLICHSEGAFSN